MSMALAAHRKKKSPGWRIGCFQIPWAAHRFKDFSHRFPCVPGMSFRVVLHTHLGASKWDHGAWGPPAKKTGGGIQRNGAEI